MTQMNVGLALYISKLDHPNVRTKVVGRRFLISKNLKIFPILFKLYFSENYTENSWKFPS